MRTFGAVLLFFVLITVIGVISGGYRFTYWLYELFAGSADFNLTMLQIIYAVWGGIKVFIALAGSLFIVRNSNTKIVTIVVAVLCLTVSLVAELVPPSVSPQLDEANKIGTVWVLVSQTIGLLCAWRAIVLMRSRQSST